MNSQLKSKLYLIVTLIFVYVLLFQYVLPINKILPKPSLLIESFIVIWSDYKILTSLAITSTSIYLSLLISVLLFNLFARTILQFSIALQNSFELVKLFKYFTLLFFTIVFVYWFKDSLWAELLFAFCISMFFLKRRIFNLSISVKETYIIISKNLGLEKKEIFSKVIKKAILPKLYDELIPIHYYLWTIILIYEFVARSEGLGGVYYRALLYDDFTIMFSLTIMISLLIWFGNSVINFINGKIFFWRSDS